MKALERDESRLNEKVDRLGGEIAGLHRTVSGLKDDPSSAVGRHA